MYKFLFILLAFVVLDIIYLTISKNYYQVELNINYNDVKLLPALLAWLIIAISYYYIVEDPFENKYIRGLFLALGMYGVYNATNYSIFTHYSMELAIRDTAWGTFLIAFVTFISSYINV